MRRWWFGRRSWNLALALTIVAGTVGCTTARTRRLAHANRTAAQTPEFRTLSAEAQAAIDSNDYEGARIALESLLILDPMQAEVHQRLAAVLEHQGKLKAAEGEYNLAIKCDPDYVFALVGLGRVETLLGRATTGLKHIDEAIEIDPGPAEAHFARGQTLEALGRADEALAAYFRALEQNPGMAQAMLRIGTIQLAKQQPEQALARLNHTLELIPEDPEARLQRGLAYLALNRPKQAAPDLKYASERFPNRPEILQQLARASQGTTR